MRSRLAHEVSAQASPRSFARECRNQSCERRWFHFSRRSCIDGITRGLAEDEINKETRAGKKRVCRNFERGRRARQHSRLKTRRCFKNQDLVVVVRAHAHEI